MHHHQGNIKTGVVVVHHAEQSAASAACVLAPQESKPSAKDFRITTVVWMVATDELAEAPTLLDIAPPNGRHG
ncbi:hypothetical protein BH24ACT13_BH24ACT13_07390 [soil metagenome]|jgi:hypothetical protein